MRTVLWWLRAVGRAIAAYFASIDAHADAGMSEEAKAERQRW